MAERLYGSINMRSYADIDILVNKDEFNKSLDLLLANGYRLYPEGIPKHIYLKFLKHYHHGRLTDPFENIVELHWELSGFYVPGLIFLDSLEPYIKTTSFQGAEVLDLTDEMLFVFLILHGSKHCWSRLEFVSVIFDFLEKYFEIDWYNILEIARKYRMLNRIVVALFFCQKLYRAKLPFAFKEGEPFRLERCGILADSIIEKEFSRSVKDNNIHPMMKFLKYQPGLMDNKIDAVKFISRSFIIPEADTWRAPSWLDTFFPVYFLEKLYRIFKWPFKHKDS